MELESVLLYLSTDTMSDGCIIKIGKPKIYGYVDSYGALLNPYRSKNIDNFNKPKIISQLKSKEF